MDKDKIYLVTVYDRDGRRVEIRVDFTLEDASNRGRSGAGFFGDRATFKVWECVEVEPRFQAP